MNRSILPLFILVASACATEDYDQVYALSDTAPSLFVEAIADMQHMGPTLIDGGLNVAVYSENAERIELLLFDDPEADLPTRRIPMVRQGDVWNIFVDGIGIGQRYGFNNLGSKLAYDEDWIVDQRQAQRCGPRRQPLQSKCPDRPLVTRVSPRPRLVQGPTASGPQRAQSTWAASSKVSSSTPPTPGPTKRRCGEKGVPTTPWRTMTGLTGHVRGAPEGLPQTERLKERRHYRGSERWPPTCDRINAVELMPIHEKPLDGGYGANNLSFFAPEHTFSAHYQATGRVDGVIDEFKWMVDQLHQNDIEVIVDVVFNHTGEGGLWRERLFFETFEDATSVNFDPKEVAGLYNFRGLDNAAWYALSPDGQTYWNNTGVGNQLRPNHRPGRRIIMDALHFMVEELHVDGFRFDLAGILGEKDLDYNTPIPVSGTIVQEIADDPVMQAHNVRLISEPWTASGTGPGIGGFPMSSNLEDFGWGEWNAHFRDWWRAFINHCNWSAYGMECHGGETLDSPAFVLNSTEGVDGGAVLLALSPSMETRDEPLPQRQLHHCSRRLHPVRSRLLRRQAE